ncbi:coiled-coil domain-containing protein 96 [Mugil cephalus]|uniref:coiled-coil domain-containing protein 96 n=1 Tax=Mugil cephalus TaxID=48193 RepID=UPI001FB5BDD8|nr:coiled-coil domain-containing protein 96 [Mugil cephalus]
MNTEHEEGKDADNEAPEEEKGDATAEMVTSDPEEELTEDEKVSGEEPGAEEGTVREPERDSSGRELLDAGEDEKMSEVNETQLVREESVVFENNVNCDDGNPRLRLESPDGEKASPAQEEDEQDEDEEEEEEATGGAGDGEDAAEYEECMQLLQELCEQRREAGQRSSQLQVKLAEYFYKKAKDGVQPEEDAPVTEQQPQEYERRVGALTELRQRLRADAEASRRRAEELRLQSKERLDKVEKEWRSLLALKRDVAVAALSRHLGKEAAQAKVESILTAERLRQDELTKQRLKHIKLTIRIRRLEAELREEEEREKEPLQIHFEQLQAERLENRKRAERQSEELSKLQKKINSSLEPLSNVKEKLYWSQMDVRAKGEQLAEVEAMLAKKRDLLTRTKQARNSLQRDNLRLKERRGLLGNRVLLRDFEDTVDASDHLEERLERLKFPPAEFAFGCGRWKKKLGKTYD